MKNITKLMILASCFIAITSIFAKSSTTQPAAKNSGPKPMATALPTTGYYATNTSTYNASVIFYDSNTKPLSSATNVAGRSKIGFPVGASFISIQNGPTFASIKTATNYILSYTASTTTDPVSGQPKTTYSWTFTPAS